MSQDPPAGLPDDVAASRRGVRLAVIVPTLVALGVFLAGTVWVARLPAEYTSGATVIFSPKVDSSGVVAAGPESVLLAANNSLGFLAAPVTVATVADASGLSAQALEGGTSAEILTGTATLRIDVTSDSSDRSASAANEYADLVVTEMAASPIVAATKIGDALADPDPSGPARTILTALCAILAALVGLLTLSLVVWGARIRNRGGTSAILRSWMTPGSPGDESPRD